MNQSTIRMWISMLLVVAVSLCQAGGHVRTGADRLVSDAGSLIAQKRVGLITNHTGLLQDGRHLLDGLLERGVRVTALFGPEHGIRGAAQAGDAVGDSVDPSTGIPVYSLYGRTSRPTPEMLREVDVLVYDIQDVGARFYTYISTMKVCMDAASQAAKPFIVLDRPNPLGEMIDGPIVEDSLRSFVGIVSIPVVYGLTAGELATMMNERGWLEGGRKADLTIVWMEGWTRSMRSATPWVPPSPNIRFASTVDVYPATCLVEATRVSEGRGTERPFHQFGAPWIHAPRLVELLRGENLPGVSFDTVSFTPVSSKHQGTLCHGTQVEVTDLQAFRPLLTGVTILSVLHRLDPDSAGLSRSSLNRLLGINRAYAWIRKGGKPVELEDSWRNELQGYREAVKPFLHYSTF